MKVDLPAPFGPSRPVMPGSRGRRPGPACSRAPCGGPAAAQVSFPRRSTRSAYDGGDEREAPGTTVERLANELRHADDPRPGGQGHCDRQHGDRHRRASAVGVEPRSLRGCGAGPTPGSTGTARPHPHEEQRGERRKTATFSAKNQLIGMKASRSPAIAQPPTDSESAVARTKPFACWTFRRSTSSGRSPP